MDAELFNKNPRRTKKNHQCIALQAKVQMDKPEKIPSIPIKFKGQKAGSILVDTVKRNNTFSADLASRLSKTRRMIRKQIDIFSGKYPDPLSPVSTDDWPDGFCTLSKITPYIPIPSQLNNRVAWLPPLLITGRVHRASFFIKWT